jgi:putative solute:sodium symporter small subunit
VEGAVDEKDRQAYWRSNLTLMAVLLSIWALVSFGAGIFFADALNEIEIIGFPLGFWFANQGSILVFLALIAIYVWRMDKLDEKYGIDVEDIDDYEGEAHHS